MVVGYIGDLGAGKTLNMIRDLRKQMIRGRKVVSNTPIKFTHKGKVYQSYTIYDTKEFTKALVNVWNATIAIDEASLYLSNYYWNKIPPEILMKFAQARKYRTDLYYTTQGWGDTIKRLRDRTNWVVFCYRRKFFGLTKVFQAVMYRPEFFKHSFLDSKKRKIFEVDRWTIYPSEAKRLYKAYNTYFRIKGSALVNMGKLENYDLSKIKNDKNIDEMLQEDVLIPNLGNLGNENKKDDEIVVN